MSTRTQCPECHGHLTDPNKCRCGWAMPQAKQIDANPNHVPCAADENCRKPGRMWVDGLLRHERICVEHYSADPRRFRSP